MGIDAGAGVREGKVYGWGSKGPLPQITGKINGTVATRNYPTEGMKWQEVQHQL